MKESNLGKETSFQIVVFYKITFVLLSSYSFFQFTLCELLMTCKYTKSVCLSLSAKEFIAFIDVSISRKRHKSGKCSAPTSLEQQVILILSRCDTDLAFGNPNIVIQRMEGMFLKLPKSLR